VHGFSLPNVPTRHQDLDIVVIRWAVLSQETPSQLMQVAYSAGLHYVVAATAAANGSLTGWFGFGG
jgi:hypothetical protein